MRGQRLGVDRNVRQSLSLKGNQGNLHKDVKLFFEAENTYPAVGRESYDGGYGRIGTRTVWATSAIARLQELHPRWLGLKSIVAVTAKRESKDKTTEEPATSSAA